MVSTFIGRFALSGAAFCGQGRSAAAYNGSHGL